MTHYGRISIAECSECPRPTVHMLTWPEQISDKICHWKNVTRKKYHGRTCDWINIALARFPHCCVRGFLRYSTLTVMDEMNANNLACQTMCQLVLLDRGISIRFSTWIENGVLKISKWPNSTSGQI